MSYRNRTFRLHSGLLAALVVCLGSGLLWGQATRTTGSRTGSGQQREYRSNTMLGDAMIQIDQETRSLVVITDDETGLEIGKIIKNLDRPKPQVLIKVLFAEVTHRDTLDFGVEGSYIYSHDGINSGALATDFGLNQLSQGGMWQLAGDDWRVTLKAIAEEGKLEVLSRPSILARNNQEAVIIVGENVPIISNSQITDNGQTINTITYIEIGIILRVTPFITTDGLVEMIVAPEISNLTDETIPISDTTSSPVIAMRRAETVVVTSSGKTVVIGGLMETESIDAVKKVPLLGDIPIIKWAFRRTIKEDTKKELLIFLTPYIVDSPEGLVNLSQDEVNRARLVPEAFGDQEEYEQFWDTLRPDAPVPGVEGGQE